MVSSADGAATLERRDAGPCPPIPTGGCSRCLRTLSDVILVGAATAREEKYKPARPRELWSHLRDGRPPTPPIAVVTRRLDLDPDSPLITAAPPHARTIVITTARRPRTAGGQLARHADIIIAGEETVDLQAAVGALAERGHRRMLAEGGPHLLAQLARGRPAGRAVPDHRPADGRPGREPDRGRRRTAHPAAAADPGSRPGGRRFPALPVHQERSLSRTGWAHRDVHGVVVSRGAAGPARTRSPPRRRGR